MGSSEAWQYRQDDDSMMECIFAHEEQAFHQAVASVQSFIDSGAISKQRACDMLSEEDYVRSTQ